MIFFGVFDVNETGSQIQYLLHALIISLFFLYNQENNNCQSDLIVYWPTNDLFAGMTDVTFKAYVTDAPLYNNHTITQEEVAAALVFMLAKLPR